MLLLINTPESKRLPVHFIYKMLFLKIQNKINKSTFITRKKKHLNSVNNYKSIKMLKH